MYAKMLFSTLFCLCLCAHAGDHRGFLPHFTTKAGEWNTHLSLANPHTVSATVQVAAYAGDGTLLATTDYTLPPFGRTLEDIHTLFPQLAADTGSLTLTSNRKDLAAQVIFTNLVTGGTSSLALSGAGRLLTMPLLDNAEDAVSGVALTNTEDHAVSLTLHLDDLDSAATRTASATLPAGAKLLGVAADFFGDDLPARAALRVQADGNLTGFSLSFRNQMQQIVAVPATVSEAGLLPELTEDLVELRDFFGMPGVAAGLDAAGSDPIVADAGLADLASNTPLQPTHSADIGSITKTFMATLFLMYEEEGLLSLDDKLADWLPEIPKSNEISLTMLLNHTSGLFDYTSTEALVDALVASYGNPQPIPPAQLVGYALTEGDGGFTFEPGTDWSYSNTGYILLGMIAEQVGGPLETQLRTRIWQPLGLSRTYLAGAEAVPGRAMQYLIDEGDLTELSQHLHMSWAWSAGAMASTPEDLMTFARALFSGGLLTQASLTKMTTPVGPAQQAEYGLGLFVGSFDGEPMWGHSGGTYGGQAFMGWLPVRRAAFATQITAAGDVGGFEELLVVTANKLVGEDAAKHGTGLDAAGRAHLRLR